MAINVQEYQLLQDFKKEGTERAENRNSEALTRNAVLGILANSATDDHTPKAPILTSPAMKIAVVKETFPGERRVALVPASVPALVKAGVEVLIEAGAGVLPAFSTPNMSKKEPRSSSRAEALCGRLPAASPPWGRIPQAGQADLPLLRPGQVVIGMCEPLWEPGRGQRAGRPRRDAASRWS